MSTPPEDDDRQHTVGDFVAELDFTDAPQFSAHREVSGETPGYTGSPSRTGNEYRKSLKLYADCVTVNRRYVAAYQL